MGSGFALAAARCSANHDPRVFEGSSRIGVCLACEIDLVQNIGRESRYALTTGVEDW